MEKQSFTERKYLPNRLGILLVFLGYTVAIFLLLLSIFYWNTFPVCFIEERGLTPFKKILKLRSLNDPVPHFEHRSNQIG